MMYLLLLAQTTPAQDAANVPVWAQLLLGGSGSAFIVWFARHMITVTIPEMQKMYSETIKEIVAEFRAETSEQRQADRSRAATSAELARSGHEAMGEVTRAVDGLKDAINKSGLTTGREK